MQGSNGEPSVSNELTPLTLDGYRSEVYRQRFRYRWRYVLRWLLGWPKMAFVLNEPTAGWYLMRGDTRSELCMTIGPCNSRAQAEEVSREWFAEQYFVTSEIVLLWDEPSCNHDRGHRRFARPWYRIPARGQARDRSSPTRLGVALTELGASLDDRRRAGR